MATHDLVIRNGTVVDGTGAAPRQADVAIDRDRITAVGEVTESADRTIDADGRLVTPGFVDIHTHLDAQVMWDPICSSSCWHGVTSIVMGNCGVTFAPVRPDDHDYLAELMESVEDIPADSIRQGLPWSWESYGEYLETLDRLPKGINVGGMVGHCAVRYYAMGDRSIDEGEQPAADELEVMRRTVDDALGSGALGFSTSRTLRHHVPDGRFVPGTWAELDELVAITEPLQRRGRGVLEFSPRFDGDGPGLPRAQQEVALMGELSRVTRRPLTFNLTHTYEHDDLWHQTLDLVTDENGRGARLRPQTTSRGVGVLFSLANMTPFDGGPEWQRLKGLSLADKLAVLRDPRRRQALIDDAANGPTPERLERFYVLTGERGARYDCRRDDALPAIAARRGVSMAEAFIDLAVETDGRLVINWPLLNQDLDVVSRMVTDPRVVLGLADAGAHVGQILDASQPTFFLTYWVRERGLMPVEEAVRRLTSDTAELVGLADRGVVQVGARADVNVIDWDRLFLPLPEFVHDFPGGAGRYVQRADGYDCTVVNGTVFMENGRHTGAFPGEVLRPPPPR